AVDPPDFRATQLVANAINDLACNFTANKSSSFACTQDAFGDNGFVEPNTQVQFCLQVTSNLTFPAADTTISARLRDTLGNLGPLRRMILRVSSGPVPPTFTAAPTRTPVTPVPTRTASATFTASRPSSPTRTATSPPTTTPRATGTPTAPPGVTPGTPTRTATPQPTRTFTWSPTPTPTRPTATATRTTTRSATPTLPHTATVTPTASPTRS